MSIETIGRQIAALRKERGVKQEELANYVGVSAQAVSKWENGGIPDTYLLPKIAEFFSVSIDSLFGRSITDYGDLQSSLCKKITETAPEQRFKLIFNYCWDMERVCFSDSIPKDGSVEDYEKEIGQKEQMYSSIMTDFGFTRMGIGNRLQYFLLVPEIADTQAAFFENIDYLTFFKDFSDKDVFDACVFLHKRENDKAFTEKLLLNNLNFNADKAARVISVLVKYNLVFETKIEMDDEVKTVYNFKPSPSFIAFLIFAREMVETPNAFSYYGSSRNKPYLK